MSGMVLASIHTNLGLDYVNNQDCMLHLLLSTRLLQHKHTDILNNLEMTVKLCQSIIGLHLSQAPFILEKLDV